MSAIEVEDHGPIRHVLVNRPERRNSLRPVDLADLIDVLNQTARLPAVRCVMLGGRGGWFSAGADLAEGVATDADGAHTLVADYQRVIQLLMGMPAAVVNVFEGVVAGAAAAFVLAADVCVAAPNSRLLFPAVMRGFVPDAGTAFFLGRVLGPARTKAVMLGDGIISAERAVAWGLIAELNEDPWAAAQVWAERLAAGPRTTMRLTRGLINDACYGGLQESLALEQFAMVAAFGTGEPAEGMAAFNKRRPAVFS